MSDIAGEVERVLGEAASGWHFHPTMYPTQAWPDVTCPHPWSSVGLPATDERVIRAASYRAGDAASGGGQS